MLQPWNPSSPKARRAASRMRCCVRWPRAPTWGLPENGARRTTATAPSGRRSRSSSAIRAPPCGLPRRRRDDTTVSQHPVTATILGTCTTAGCGGVMTQALVYGHRDGGDEGGQTMEYRPFGRTELQVSAIGFGCWEVGGGYGHVEEAEFARAVGRALDLGINCFDTAEGDGMGASEPALAKALGGRRDEAGVGTKVGMKHRGKPKPPGHNREPGVASIRQGPKEPRTR